MRAALAEALWRARVEQRLVRAPTAEQLGDELRRQWRLQDPIAVVARRPDEPSQRPGAEEGKVVGRSRSQPNAQLFDLELARAGDELEGVAQQLIRAARCGGVVEAALLNRSAEHVAAVRARHQVALGEAHRARKQPRPPGGAQAKRLPLDGPHGHARPRRQALHGGTPGAGGDDHVPREQPLAGGELYATGAVAL